MNPSSITSPRAGDRNRRQNRNPRDLTGKAYQAQHAQHDAKRAVLADPDTIRKVSWREGFSSGFDTGYESGADAGVLSVVAIYKSEGPAGLDRLVAELDAAGSAENESAEDEGE